MLCHHFCAHLATFTPGNRKTPEHVMQLRAALRPQGALEESVEKAKPTQEEGRPASIAPEEAAAILLQPSKQLRLSLQQKKHEPTLPQLHGQFVLMCLRSGGVGGR